MPPLPPASLFLFRERPRNRASAIGFALVLDATGAQRAPRTIWRVGGTSDAAVRESAPARARSALALGVCATGLLLPLLLVLVLPLLRRPLPNGA